MNQKRLPFGSRFLMQNSECKMQNYFSSSAGISMAMRL